jgi:hypothetical protein
VGSGAIASSIASNIAVGDQEVLELRGALPRGVSVAFQAVTTEPVYFPGVGEVLRLAAIIVSREEDESISAALMLESLDRDSSTGPDREVVERQIILLEDAPGIGGDPLVLLFPSPFDPFGTSGFSAVVEIERQELDAAHQAAVQQCVADLRREGEEARISASGFGLPELLAHTVTRSLQALELAEHQRPAVVFLTSTHAAPLALDLALSTDATTLAAWVKMFMERTGEEIVFADNLDEEMGWAMDSVAWELLAERLDDGELPAGLRGTLVRHAGEAGRFPGSIADALRFSTDQATFRDAIVDENRSFLASSDPAARVRAFDWLSSHDLAPEGYDPLATRNERRDALVRDEARRRPEDRR